MLTSLLKVTEKGPAELNSVNLDARLPQSLTSTLIAKLQNENLIYLENNKIHVDAESRLKLAVKAIQLGADIERVSTYLHWQEFEAMAALALELNGYTTKRNVHFTHEKKRWEIDVVGCRKPIVVCIDCKHWHHGMHPSTLSKMSLSQAQRAADFAEYIACAPRDFPCTKWDQAKFVPIMLSLISFTDRFCECIPVVPVLQMQDFINQLPLNMDCLKVFSKKFCHL